MGEAQDLQMPLLGYPGTWTVTSGRAPNFTATTGPYRVTFFFGTPGLSAYQLTANGSDVGLLLDSAADSPILFQDIEPNGVRPMGLRRTNSPTVRGELKVNSFSRLASVKVFEVMGDHPLEAVHQAGEYFFPHLNWLCYRQKVGVEVSAILAVNADYTETWLYHYRPYDVAGTRFQEAFCEFSEGLIPYFALYREAMASTNPYYQVIVFTKLIEGIDNASELKKLQPEGLLDERVPSHPRVPEKFRGQKINAFMNHVRLELRHALAHFELEKSGMIHVPDLMYDMRSVQLILPAIRAVVRVKLENLRRRVHELQGSGIFLPVDEEFG